MPVYSILIFTYNVDSYADLLQCSPMYPHYICTCWFAIMYPVLLGRPPSVSDRLFFTCVLAPLIIYPGLLNNLSYVYYVMIFPSVSGSADSLQKIHCGLLPTLNKVHLINLQWIWFPLIYVCCRLFRWELRKVYYERVQASIKLNS